MPEIPAAPLPLSGPNLKGHTKRKEILEIALDLIADNGYANTSLQQIAEAANISKAGLLYHFGSKENLLTQVLRRRDERDTALFTEGAATEPRISRIVRHNAEVPGLIELYSALLQEGVDDEHPAHSYFVDRYSRVSSNVTEDILQGIREGVLMPGLDAPVLARLLLAVSDGLQQQWQYDRSIVVSAHLEYLWSLLKRQDGLGDESHPEATP
jgi:AcrR family transcriptional regulator